MLGKKGTEVKRMLEKEGKESRCWYGPQEGDEDSRKRDEGMFVGQECDERSWRDREELRKMLRRCWTDRKEMRKMLMRCWMLEKNG